VLLPAQQLGLQGLGFRLGDHALVLIQDGEAGVGQDFIGVQLEQSLGHRDGGVEITLLLQRADEPVHCIKHAGVRFEALTELLHGSCGIAFREPVEALVVEIFSAG